MYTHTGSRRLAGSLVKSQHLRACFFAFQDMGVKLGKLFRFQADYLYTRDKAGIMHSITGLEKVL